MAKEYMSLADCVEIWKMPLQRIEQLCEEGKIKGVAKLGGMWIVPVDAKKPFEEKRSKPVIPRNVMQGVTPKYIEDNSPFGCTIECEIGNTTYSIRGFGRQDPKIEEMVTLIAQDLELETGMQFSVESLEELKRKARKYNSTAAATFDDCACYFRRQLEDYDFSAEYIEVLLRKIAVEYEPFLS